MHNTMMWSFSSIFAPAFLSKWLRGSKPRRPPNTTWFSTTFDSSAGSTSWRDRVRSGMQPRHLVPGRPLGRFHVGVASRTSTANLSWNILFTWPKCRNWDLYLEKWLYIQSFTNFTAAHFIAKNVMSWKCIDLWVYCYFFLFESIKLN